MKCDNCRRFAATVHSTALEAGRIRETHLCRECAKASEPLHELMLAPEAVVPPQGKSLVCPSCRHLNQPNWNFCSACGAMREP